MVESILKRLTSQLKNKGLTNASKIAKSLLEKRGQMRNGILTPEGKKREQLGRAGRSNDRAAKYNGGTPSNYKYNPKTNRSRKK